MARLRWVMPLGPSARPTIERSAAIREEDWIAIRELWIGIRIGRGVAPQLPSGVAVI